MYKKLPVYVAKPNKRLMDFGVEVAGFAERHNDVCTKEGHPKIMDD
jgi:hypothetical protein